MLSAATDAFDSLTKICVFISQLKFIKDRKLLSITYPLNFSLAGLLCYYKSSLQLGKNEKTGRRHFIEDAKVHRQILDNLLNEVRISVHFEQRFEFKDQALDFGNSIKNFARKVTYYPTY